MPAAAAAILDGMPDARDLHHLDSGGQTMIFAGPVQLFPSTPRRTRQRGTWRWRCCGSLGSAARRSPR